jgi:hypothetical protein
MDGVRAAAGRLDVESGAAERPGGARIERGVQPKPAKRQTRKRARAPFLADIDMVFCDRAASG